MEPSQVSVRWYSSREPTAQEFLSDVPKELEEVAEERMGCSMTNSEISSPDKLTRASCWSQAPSSGGDLLPPAGVEF